MDYKVMWLLLKENMKNSNEEINTTMIYNTMKSLENGEYDELMIDFEINSRSIWAKKFIDDGRIEDAIRVATKIVELQQRKL